MIAGLLWLIVANVAAFLGSFSLWRRIRTGSATDDFLMFLLVRLLVLSTVMLLAGMTGTLRALPLGLVGAATIVVLTLLREYPARTSLRIPKIPTIMLLGMVVVGLRLMAQVWFFAPYVGDVASYHLPKVAEWIRAGAFTREMGVDSHVTFPAGFELIETWWVVFLRHDVLIEIAGVEFVALSFAAVTALARRVGLPLSAALGAAFLYVMTPGVHLQSTACMNDAPAAALLLSAMALVAARTPFAWICIPLGLGVGVKPTFAFAAPGILMLWLLVRRESSCVPVASKSARWLAGAAVFVGAFWYARNAAWFGNPFHPMGSEGIADVGRRTTVQFGANLHSLFSNVLSLLESRVSDARAPYGPLMTGGSGWGAVPFACGSLGFLLQLREDSGIRKIAGALLVSSVAVLLLVRHDDWSMRFILFLPALFCIGAAWFSHRSRAGAWICACAFLLEFMGTWIPNELSADGLAVLARQSWRERSASPLYGAGVSGESIGYFADQYGEVYVLYGPDFSRRVEYLRSQSADALIRDMRRTGVSQLYAVPTSLLRVRILEECVRRDQLSQVTDRVFVLK